LLLLFATDTLQNAAADGETRTLTIHHTHTGEDITVTFKRNGRYDDAALAKLNHFLRDWRNNDQTKMDPRLFDVVWEVYQDVGAKQPIQIISAYRSPATNAMLRRRSRGVAQFSQHMLGKAMDFNIPGVGLEQVRIAGLRLQRGGVGFYPTSGSPFVHLDVGSVRHWPRMTHDQLVRVFPNGRTVHVPSDGRPLPGYALALADIERRGSSPPSRVSLASAEASGVKANDAASGKRNMLARLLGFGANSADDEDETTADKFKKVPLPKAQEPKAREPKAQPVEVAAAAVPMPRTRPAPREALVAANTPRTQPAPAGAARNPADIVAQRGLWHTAEMLEAASAPAPQRRWEPWVLVKKHTPAPAPVVVKGTTTVVAKSTASARKEAAVVIATAGSDITGSLPAWVGAASPAQGILAYAAQQAPETTAPAAAPMGTLQPARAAHRAKREPVAVTSRTLPAAKRLIDNPWLRGVIAAPSMQTAMAVTMMGAPNYGALSELMHKPRTSVVNPFAVADAAPFGLSSQTFSGGVAVSFVPTVTFGTLTAELR
jgi:uncharacterized protein YcbK (DUF882 family)